MRIAVIGSAGQFGSDIADVFGKEALPLTHDKIEIRNIESCRRALKNADAVINCAGYVNVDECEDHPDEAFMVNTIGARNVSMVCDEEQIPVVYISTDFVFDGNKKEPYRENDVPNPINIYGFSKYGGEIFTRNYCTRSYVIRSSSIYGRIGSRGKKGNFVRWMIEKANNNEAINVVDDIVMSPTYTRDAAEMIRTILEKELPYGIYHVANNGYCSWFEFAGKIFELLNIDADLRPTKSKDLIRKARRPGFSALECEKLNGYGYHLRNWDDALRDYLKENK